jgi:uncharacterized membrane protein YebE (DUF533 family)
MDMIDVKSILGSLLEANMTPSSARRVEHAVNSPQVSGTGSLLSELLAAGQKAMGDTRRETQAGNPVAIGGLGALAGAILGGAKGSAPRGALGGAALALLGQIAFSALQGKLAGAASGTGRVVTEEDLPLGMREPKTPGEEAVLRSRGMILIQAMISAAKADGQIDGREMERILGKLDESGADQEAKDFVLAEMRRPLDVDALAAQVEAPDLAAEVYAASLLAIEVDTAAERAYLDRLAAALRLDQAARAQIHAALGVTSAPA